MIFVHFCAINGTYIIGTIERLKFNQTDVAEHDASLRPQSSALELYLLSLGAHMLDFSLKAVLSQRFAVRDNLSSLI